MVKDHLEKSKQAFAFSKWWSQAGSNRRPPACKAGALPAELWPLACLFSVWPRCACRSVGHVLMYAPSLTPAPALPAEKNPARGNKIHSSHFPGPKSRIVQVGRSPIRRVRQYVRGGDRSSCAILVGLGRFELPTSPLSGVRSNQLSYRPKNYRQGPIKNKTQTHHLCAVTNIATDPMSGSEPFLENR